MHNSSLGAQPLQWLNRLNVAQRLMLLMAFWTWQSVLAAKTRPRGVQMRLAELG